MRFFEVTRRYSDRLGLTFLYDATRLRRFGLFLVVGVVNTVLSYSIYILSLLVTNYSVAYTVSWVGGLGISYYLNSRFVFETKPRLSTALRYPIVYLLQYLLGLVSLYILVERLHLSAKVAPLLVVCVSVPITYVASRYVIVGRSALVEKPNN